MFRRFYHDGVKISSKILEKAIYELCDKAACNLSADVMSLMRTEFYRSKSPRAAHILQNAAKAYETARPLCQDTGCVHVFLEIGNNITFEQNPETVINKAVAKVYTEKFFRKSVIENGLLSGKNTKNNTPAVIETEFTDTDDELKISVLLKGAGCDNMSFSKMLLPATTLDELEDFLVTSICKNGKFACPPVFVSVATGGSSHNVLALAEKNFFDKKNDFPELCERIKRRVNGSVDKKYGEFFLADIKIRAFAHHMASLPLGAAINCQSLRTCSCVIKPDKITILTDYDNFEAPETDNSETREIFTHDTDTAKALKTGENILLTGKILIARDAAHKKMLEIRKNGGVLPFKTENEFIFYAGPCPAKPGEITGPVGPTTSFRMDKYLPEFPEIAGTIGKGARTKDAEAFIKQNNSVYFEAEGGIATLLASKFKSMKVIAFEDLGAEAVFEAQVEKLPLTVAIGR